MFVELTNLLGYKFNNYAYLEEALTHPSYSLNHHTHSHLNYQRLEFLGDAVLGFIITELLLSSYPNEDEGSLAKRRAALVCQETLSAISLKLNLGKYIIMTHGEDNAGGRKNLHNLEDALEAIIGAIYLDGGIEQARGFIKCFWLEIIAQMKEVPKDPKTSLQEWAQQHGRAIPKYTIIESGGPAHAPFFIIEVSVDGYEKVSARAQNKKLAQKLAAIALLKQIQQ
jgi:ribonuclease-3